MLLKWWTVYFKSHKLSYSCEKYYGPKPFCPPESSSMTPNDSWGSVWETLPQSPRHHCCEKSTPNPQRYQFFHFISHHPILPAYKISPIPHPKTSGSLLLLPSTSSLAWPPPIIQRDWRRLWTIQPPNPQKSGQLAWVLFWWLHSWNTWEECPGRSSLRKHSKRKSTSKDLLQLTWFSTVFSKSLVSLNFLYLTKGTGFLIV